MFCCLRRREGRMKRGHLALRRRAVALGTPTSTRRLPHLATALGDNILAHQTPQKRYRYLVLARVTPQRPLGSAWACGTALALPWASCPPCWIGGAVRKRVRSATSPMPSASSSMILAASLNTVCAWADLPLALYNPPNAAWICHCSPGNPISAATWAASRKWPMACSFCPSHAARTANDRTY